MKLRSFVLLTQLFMISGTVQAFNCKKAKSPVEKAICADLGLKAMDDAMSNAYEQDHAADKVEYQKTWLASRDACAKNANVRACIFDKMLERIQEICKQEYLGKTEADGSYEGSCLKWSFESYTIYAESVPPNDAIYSDMKAIAKNPLEVSVRFFNQYENEALALKGKAECQKIIAVADPLVLVPEPDTTYLKPYLERRKECDAPQSSYESDAKKDFQKSVTSIQSLLKEIIALLPESPAKDEATGSRYLKLTDDGARDSLERQDAKFTLKQLEEQKKGLMSIASTCSIPLSKPFTGKMGCQPLSNKIKGEKGVGEVSLNVWYTYSRAWKEPLFVQLVSAAGKEVQVLKFSQDMFPGDNFEYFESNLVQGNCGGSKLDIAFVTGAGKSGIISAECWKFHPKTHLYDSVSSEVDLDKYSNLFPDE